MNEIELTEEKKEYIENFVNKINEEIKLSEAKISHIITEKDGDIYQLTFGKSIAHFKIGDYNGDWVTFIKSKLVKKAINDQQ